MREAYLVFLAQERRPVLLDVGLVLANEICLLLELL